MAADDGERGDARRPSKKFKAVLFLVAFLGTLSLAVGLWAAWQSQAATAAVLAGAALIALALLLASDIAELSGQWRGGGVKVVRGVPESTVERVAVELRAALAQAGRPDTAPDERLQVLAERVEAVAAQADRAAETEREDSYQRWIRFFPALVKLGEVGTAFPMPQYSFRRYHDQGPTIDMVVDWWGDWLLRSSVLTPSGEEVRADFFAREYMGNNRFAFTYPRDYPGAPPLEPGTYTFRWLRGAGARWRWPGDQALATDDVVVSADLVDGIPGHYEPQVERTWSQADEAEG